jgi:membrane-bound lytic murein transglycosylase B
VRIIRGSSVTLCLFILAISQLALADYSNHPRAIEWVKGLPEDAVWDRQSVRTLLAKAEKKQAILDAIARPAEKTKPWHEYRALFLNAERIKLGVAFWQQHAALLQTLEAEYGVPPEIVVAIVGVETRYGKFMGNYRVLDALATLGFDYPERSAFFLGQLKEYIQLCHEQGLDPTVLMGSYAGAMGFGQFIPSSYRAFAVDYDGDGFADIWKNPADALASVANYFKAHGWQKKAEVVTRVTLKRPVEAAVLNDKNPPSRTLSQWQALGVTIPRHLDPQQKAILLALEAKSETEYWLGHQNFYTITRYNRSHLYAMAVYDLSLAIASDYRVQANQSRGHAQPVAP